MCSEGAAVKQWMHAVTMVRPTLAVALAAFLVFSQPSQILELYAIHIDALAEGASERAWLGMLPELGGALLAMGMLMVALWVASLHLMSLKADMAGARLAPAVLSAVVAVVPLAGLALGLESASSRAALLSQSDRAGLLMAAAVSAGAAALAVGLLLALLAHLGPGRAERLGGAFATPAGFAAAVLAFAALALATAFGGRWSPEHLGVIVLLLFFLTLSAVVLTCFSALYWRTGVPATLLVVGFAAVLSALGINDNRKVDAALIATPAAELERGFLAWAAARADRDHFEGKPYPVYIVAAEGGGLYAAYHVASTLAKLQDACPGFSQHVFAISSVSGGSLGSAVFAAAAQATASNEPWQDCAAIGAGAAQDLVRGYFANDFLSPLVAARLYPDVLQRFLPAPVKAFDPARALVRSFEDAWQGNGDADGGASPNPFKQPLASLWSADGAAPALFLNATSVATGARVTLSPLAFDATPTAIHASQALCIVTGSYPTLDITLSEAVSLSARFPWITPAGWIERDQAWSASGACRRSALKGGSRLYLADGGYFENSGLETALDIATRLKRVAERNKQAFPAGFDIKIVMIFANDELLTRWVDADSDLLGQGPDELLQPISTLMLTRQARTRAIHSRVVAFDDANFQSGPYFDCTGKYVLPSPLQSGADDVHQVMLDALKLALPLGWRLSAHGLGDIETYTSEATGLAFALIRSELTGRPPEMAKRRVACAGAPQAKPEASR